MPELPEVETTRRGIQPHILDRAITELVVRNRNFRWPVARNLASKLVGQKIQKVDRRAKYLLLHMEKGCLILHLGMSGSLSIVNDNSPPLKHDHIDINFDSSTTLRFRDPRRFGAVLFANKDVERHKLISHLGPEPLGKQLSGVYLFNKSRGIKQSVKTFIMDNHIVVGVGNIYASEALFLCRISPKRQAGRISAQRFEKLSRAIKDVLKRAIKAGGTTLRDFSNGDGQPGYFQQKLNVYAREGEPCLVCKTAIKQVRLRQRSTFYCSNCQC